LSSATGTAGPRLQPRRRAGRASYRKDGEKFLHFGAGTLLANHLDAGGGRHDLLKGCPTLPALVLKERHSILLLSVPVINRIPPSLKFTPDEILKDGIIDKNSLLSGI
jgi:hypothetical protein